MSDYEPKCKKTLPIIFDDRMPASNLTPKLVSRVNDNTEDLKNLYGDEITHLKQDINELEEGKADASGTSENLTAGNAEQLMTDKGITDKVPYLLRASGGNGADREQDKIVGGTVAWNQIVPATAQSANGVTNNGDGTFTVAAGVTTYFILGTFNEKVNHIYLLNSGGGIDSTCYLRIDNTSGNAWTTQVSAFLKKTPDSSNDKNIYICANLPETTCTLTPQLFDLTQMFGSTIADYIYSLEQAHAGDGVAWFRKLFPKDYYPYDAGTLKHVSGLVSHDMTGFNQFDADTVFGSYNFTKQSDGSWYWGSSNTTLLNKEIWKNESGYTGKIHIYIKYKYDSGTGSSGLRPKIMFTDGTALNTSMTVSTSWQILNVTSTAGKTVDKVILDYGSASNHTWFEEFCINFSWDGSRNGEYEPYVKHSYSLDSTLTLRGIPKLDSNNQVYYDGDTYASDGTVTRRYGVVDLGTLTWTYDAQYSRFISSTNIGAKAVLNNNTPANALCAKYENGCANDIGYKDSFVYISPPSGNAGVRVIDKSYTDAATFKAAVSGVYLVYELATPTTEEADSYQNPQIVDPYGTEEYETTGIVPVGHDTLYPENLRAKIEGLPFNFATLIAPTESTYKATRAYSANNLFIVNNILYKATTSIASGGTITPGTNCTATTLAEIIAALS